MTTLLHLALALGVSASLVATSLAAADLPVLRFKPAANGGFTFDTGVLRGALHTGGKSLGLTAVTHVPTGTRLDRSNGLLSHYRVFTRGVRYGGGAWDWPSVATLQPDGSVEVRWAADENRPFQLRALYRWVGADTVDVQTTVTAERDLTGFESFLACYFGNGFTNAAVLGTRPDSTEVEFIAADRKYGDWLMFPRDDAVVALINDGRWKLEPNPVAWRIMPPFAAPLAVRRDPTRGLAAVLMSRASDCFSVASPHQSEGHFSTYLSLFGRDLKAGAAASVRCRLAILTGASDEHARALHRAFKP